MRIEYDKLRGGYYTPEKITDFLSGWVMKKAKNILEPSAGDGVFVKSILKRISNTKSDAMITSIELDHEEGKKISNLYEKFNFKRAHHIEGDFFTQATDFINNGVQFDGILGNPPFIRYQDFIEEYRTKAFELMNSFGMTPNRLTNIWVPFLVICSKLLKKGGRIGMVIPTELFQVNYAAETRKFLSEEYSNIILVTFKKLLFSNAQQEVVLLLAEKNGKNSSHIKVLELNDETELKSLTDKRLNQVEAKELLHSKDKWTYYFLEKSEIDFLNEIREKVNYPLANKVIDVDVGIVTGRNEFFILKPEKKKDLNLKESCIGIVARSNHLRGILFSPKDSKKNIKDNLPSFMFYPDREKLSNSEKKYINYGESKEFHKGYKCRIRKKWHVVPSVWVPDAFMLRQIHEYPKIIINSNKSTCTDTIHRVRILHKNKKMIATAFINSLTFVYSELLGRSYGGGVLTFEPSECEMLPFPTKGMSNLDFNLIDKLVREKNIEKALDLNDKILLEENLGLTKFEVKKLRSIWHKLKNRRLNRGK